MYKQFLIKGLLSVVVLGWGLTGCSDSEPETPSGTQTTPTYPVVLSIDMANASFEGKSASAMLVKPSTGEVVAMVLAHPRHALNTGGAKSIRLENVDCTGPSGSNSSSSVAVPAGSYRLYFMLDSNGAFNHQVPTSCEGITDGSSGYITNAEFGAVVNVEVNGTTYVTLDQTNVLSTTALDMNVATIPGATFGLCVVFPEEVTPSYSAVGVSSLGMSLGTLTSGAGTLSGAMLPAGGYAIWCLGDTDGNLDLSSGDVTTSILVGGISGAVATVDLTSGWTVY